MFSLLLVADFILLFAFSYAFCGGNWVASFESSDHRVRLHELTVSVNGVPIRFLSKDKLENYNIYHSITCNPRFAWLPG